MENPEEILHSLEEFSKMKPKDIPRELEEYLTFVAKTGDPVYQWGSIKSLFREKLINVITEFYESCPVMEIPPCPNVDLFNYDLMKSFILEKLEAFNSAPFTLQRICELLTSPRKEYNRIDKFMRALEKNILVVSTVEPGGRRSNENGDGIMNGIETEPPVPEPGAEINIEEMDETPSWSQEVSANHVAFENGSNSEVSSTNPECIISCTIVGNQPYVSIEPLSSDALVKEKTDENSEESETTASPEKPQESVTPASEADLTEELVITDAVAESSSETPVPSVKDETRMLSEVTDSELHLEVVEKPEEIAGKSVVDEVEKEVVTEQTVETMGIENISPETSTESSDTLHSDEKIEEKVDKKVDKIEESVQEKEDIKTAEDVCVKEEKESDKKVDKLEHVAQSEKAENDETKLEEKEGSDDLGQGDTKIDIESLVTKSSSEEITKKSNEPIEKEKDDSTSGKSIKESEEVEVNAVEVEPMTVVETPSEEKPTEDNKAEQNTDPLSIEDDKEKEIEKMSADPAEEKIEKTDTEANEEITPMEVDAIEEKGSVEKEEPKEVLEEKEITSGENKAES